MDIISVLRINVNVALHKICLNVKDSKEMFEISESTFGWENTVTEKGRQWFLHWNKSIDFEQHWKQN